MNRSKHAFLAVPLLAFVAATTGCGASADEKTSAVGSRIQEKAEIIGDRYVETWEDEETAIQRANDMRDIGLSVERRGLVLYVDPVSDSTDVGAMMDAAGSDVYAAYWGDGGTVATASRPLAIQTAITPKDVSYQPPPLGFDTSIDGDLRMSGELSVNPSFDFHLAGCGRRCVSFEGSAGFTASGWARLTVIGSVSASRDLASKELRLGRAPLGALLMVLPGPIPIPVYAQLYIEPKINCFGELEGSAEASASFSLGARASFWAHLSTSSAPEGDGSITASGQADADVDPHIEHVSFGCTLPKVQLGVKINFLGGPFVAVGPAVALVSDAEGHLDVELQSKSSFGIEAEDIGLGNFEYERETVVLGSKRIY